MNDPTKRHRPVGKTAEAESGAPATAPLRLLWQGWMTVAGWMTLGLLLEGLMAFKVPAYLGDAQRRELLRLAHAHGALLGLLLIAAASSMSRGVAMPPVAQWALRTGTVLLPVGFLLAGIWHPEGDPGWGIWLVPVGALSVIFGVVALALSARQAEQNARRDHLGTGT